MKMESAFEPVIGLEIHVQLNTRRKLLAPEGFEFGSAPNEWLSPVTAAHPGTLPYPNLAARNAAIKLGLAVGSHISPVSRFDRKHYFYPDLPKGYQTSQDAVPICIGGEIRFFTPDGQPGRVELERIHMEEDAGKLIHDLSPAASMIDLNRAGAPLLEMVTRPGLFSAQEAAACFSAVRTLVRHLGICDGNLEEGSMRCDANISIRPRGQSALGTRVEIKNLNSFAFLVQAVQFEIARQESLLLEGGRVQRETRGWDPLRQQTYGLREKEDAEDYRYFPDPDLLPLVVTEQDIARIRAELPALPQDLFVTWTTDHGLQAAEAFSLLESQSRAAYFEALCRVVPGREAANWLLGPVQSWLNRQENKPQTPPVSPEKLGKLIHAVISGQVTHHAAKESALPALLDAPDAPVEDWIQTLSGQSADAASQLDAAMEAIMAANPDEVVRYRQGKKNLLGFFVGQMMREFGGKADPRAVNEAVRRQLEGGKKN